jgi:hypothetical protein
MLWSINIWQTIKLQWRSTLCDKVCQLLTTGWWFSLGTTVSSTNKTYRYDITEILLKVVINTINQPMFFFTQRQTIIFTWKQKPDYYFFFFLHEKSMIFPKILSKVSSRCKLQVRSIILQLLGQFFFFAIKFDDRILFRWFPLSYVMVFFCVQWVEMSVGCLFWPSLFKLSFHNN